MAMKQTVARVLQSGVRRARNLVERLDPTTIPGNFSNPEVIYSRLNGLMDRLVSEERGVLRPHYTWGVLHGAHLAKTLGYTHLSVAEFGVAGGKGLLALERAAERVEALFGVTIDVHGFDTGAGLPKPSDYRDLPNLYAESDYRMDVEALRARLRRAHLHVGLVRDTVSAFVATRPAPLAFAAFDLDYYSSTMDAFAVFDVACELLLPRVHCYFDDIMGFTCSEFTGVRLAIDDFNAAHGGRKISPIFGLKYFLPPYYGQQQWSEMFYLAHFFDHPRYGQNDGLVITKRDSQLPPAAATAIRVLTAISLGSTP
jgi:hypothetical protein